MTEIKKEPPVVVTLPAVSPKRKFNGGLMPGEFRGVRSSMALPREEDDPDAEVWAKVRSMSAPEMRKWLKDPINQAAFDRARQNKGTK